MVYRHKLPYAANTMCDDFNNANISDSYFDFKGILCFVSTISIGFGCLCFLLFVILMLIIAKAVQIEERKRKQMLKMA